MQPDVLNSRESVPARDGRHRRCHVSILTPHGMGAAPLPLRPLAGFGRPGWGSAGGFGAGGGQGVVILIKCPGDLIEGAGGCGEVVIVGGPLGVVHRGEGVAGGFEGVHLLVLQVGVAQSAVSRRLGAVAAREHVAGLLQGVVVHGQVMLPGFGEAVKAMQLSARPVHTVGKAVGKFLHRRVVPNKHIASCGKTGTSVTKAKNTHK